MNKKIEMCACSEFAEQALPFTGVRNGMRALLTLIVAGATLACVPGGGGGGESPTIGGEDEGMLLITPSTDLVSSGVEGGSFSPGSQVYSVTNNGTSALNWSAGIDVSWAQISSTGGSLAVGDSVPFTISINQGMAAALAPGGYTGLVTFIDTDTGDRGTRDVILSITPSGSSSTDLTLTPGVSFDSTGNQGGPFAPANMTYTLTNSGSSTVAWSINASQAWIAVSANAGNLAAGASLGVVVSIDQGVASTLPVGGFSGLVTFSDTAAGVDITRSVNLTVNPAGGNGSGSMASSVTQFGITWTFDRNYLVGQFANADWWVVGPLNVIGISPQSVVSGSRTTNGSEINPLPSRGMRQGFDSSMYGIYKSSGDYSAALNVGLGISAGSPLNVPVSSSLVSTRSIPAADARPQIATAAVLTVLASAPVAGSFRPAYVGGNKSILFNESQLDYSKLGRLAPVGQRMNINEVASNFERPWLDHVAKFPGRYLHPEDNMMDYGRDLTSEISVGALCLQMNYTDAEKRTLLVRFVQLGIDLYGITQYGGKGNWEPAQGHSGGRKWPILFAGIMLSDPVMSNVGFDLSIDFGEDGQTFYVEETSPGTYNYGFGGYNAGDVGLAEWGGFHSAKVTTDEKDWFINPYRLCCTSNTWWGILLSAHVMGAVGAWNHDELFDYQDRFRSENKRLGITDFRNAWRDFDFEMYDAYRDNY